MGGQQRNSKLLRLVIGTVAVLLAVYVLYGYRQSYNDATIKSRHLKEAEDEYHALSKRFDMLSNELKGTVQASASLEKELRSERNMHQDTKGEKEELKRQCHAEASRQENDKAQMLKEKQQLVEDKDQVKRERDRLSSQLETLTQECSDARESALSRERQLQTDCDGKLNQCNTRYSSVDEKLNQCRTTYSSVDEKLNQCNIKYSSVDGELTSCKSSLTNAHNDINSCVSQLRNDGHQSQQKGVEQRFSDNKQQPQQFGQHNQQWNHPGGIAQEQQQQQQQHQQQVNAPSWLKSSRHPDNQPQFQSRQDGFNYERNPYPQPANPVPLDRQSQVRFKDPLPGKDPHDSESLVRHNPNDGGVKGDVKPQGEDPHQHLTDEQKREIYKKLKNKVERGEIIDPKQEQLYQLLSRRFKDERHQRNPVPSNHQEAVIQQPPAPNGPVLGGPNNNEQEEVKDLVDGAGAGQQKPGVFENVKEKQVGGAAGGPNEEPDGGVELVEGREGRNEPPPNHGNNVHPLDEPVRNKEGREGVNDEFEDGDDVGDYGAVAHVQERKHGVNQDNHNIEDEGRHVFLEDQQQMYNEERRRLVRREGERDSREGVGEEERAGHWKAMEQKAVAAHQKEMR